MDSTDRIRRNLAAAIETMRDACDEAERRAKYGDIDACSNVMHSLAWGYANATSNIECAITAAKDAYEIALMSGDGPTARKER